MHRVTPLWAVLAVATHSTPAAAGGMQVLWRTGAMPLVFPAASAPRRGASKSAVSEPDTDGQAVQPKRTASRRRGAAAAEEPKTPRDAKTAAGATPPVPATPAAIRAVRRMLGPMPAHDLVRSWRDTSQNSPLVQGTYCCCFRTVSVGI